MERYRIEVGREHGVLPKHIVGAIANEADIESRHIGRIDLHETYSTVDLPQGLPKELWQHLRKVWVVGRTMNITREGEPPIIPEAKERKTLRMPNAQRPAKSFKGKGDRKPFAKKPGARDKRR